MKTFMAMIVCCVACSSSQPVVHHIQPTMTKAPSDDINYTVQPAWHDGKQVELPQNLKANTTTKQQLGYQCCDATGKALCDLVSGDFQGTNCSCGDGVGTVCR